MKTKRRESNLQSYFESLRILEHGTEEEIASAKRAYWKEWYKNYRRKQRQEKPEFSVSLLRDDYNKIKPAAKRHKMSVTEFLRAGTLAYIDKTFLILNPDQVIRIEQALMQCLNEVQAITHTKEKYQWERERKYDAIAERIGKLEAEIKQALCFPKEANMQ